MRHFTAFFSYAHDDGDADPRLVEALTKGLESRVNVRLVNDRFGIWRDAKGLRAADKWDEKIREIIANADIFIALLTPRWIGSNYCREEFKLFEETENARSIDDYTAGYIAPILV